MKRFLTFLAELLFATALLLSWARTARAGGVFSLNAGFDGEEWKSRLRLESAVWRKGSWRLEAAAGIPGEMESGEEAHADLALSRSGDPWRWTGTLRLMETTAGRRGFFQLRGTFRRREQFFSATLGEQDLADPSRETGVLLRAARSLGRSWRFSAAQGWAEVITDARAERRRDYTAEAGLAWRGGGRGMALLLGGRASRGEDPGDDRRNLYGELEGEAGFGSGWSLAASIRCAREEEAGAGGETTTLKMDLRRRGPWGLRGQVSWTAAPGAEPSLRAGIAFTGGRGGWRWRLGGAAERNAGGGVASAWVYAGLIWESSGKTWRIETGLAPEGEYAVNSRHGYWIAAERRF